MTFLLKTKMEIVVRCKKLQGRFGDILWETHARMIAVESKKQYYSYKKVASRAGRSSTSELQSQSQSQAPSTTVLPVLDDPDSGIIDALFSDILSSIESRKWEMASEHVKTLKTYLQVSSGRQSRHRGGWKYTCDFVLDTVVFADVLARLHEDEDVMSKAIKLTLGYCNCNRCQFSFQ